MKACFARLIQCLIGLAAASLILGLPVTLSGGLWWGALVWLLYVFVRPLAQLILLPLNMLLLGLLTLASDALLILWAAAWTPALTAPTYLQALAAAALISICAMPLSAKRRGEIRVYTSSAV